MNNTPWSATQALRGLPGAVRLAESPKSLLRKAYDLVRHLPSVPAQAREVGATPSTWRRWLEQVGSDWEGEPRFEGGGEAVLRAFLARRGVLSGPDLTYGEGVERGKVLAVEAVEKRLGGTLPGVREELGLPISRPPGSRLARGGGRSADATEADRENGRGGQKKGPGRRAEGE